MIQRTLYYWSKLYEEQIEQTENYKKLSRTVCINILNYDYLDNNRFHNAYILKELGTNEELTNICEIHFIEIPKLRKLNLDDDADMLKLSTFNLLRRLRSNLLEIFTLEQVLHL